MQRNRGGEISDFDPQRGFDRRSWENLQRHFDDRAEESAAADHQFGQVVTGRIFHDSTAAGDDRRGAIDQANPHHKIADATILQPPGTAEPSRDGPADRRAGFNQRRIEWEVLAMGIERLLQFGDRGPGQCGDQKLRRLMVHNATQRRHLHPRCVASSSCHRRLGRRAYDVNPLVLAHRRDDFFNAGRSDRDFRVGHHGRQ